MGFDWDGADGALEKVEEELAEVRRALAGDGDIEEELGDLLFAVVNVAHHKKVDAERAVEKTCDKFIHRFGFMERQAKEENKVLSDLSLAEMDSLWNRSKEKV